MLQKTVSYIKVAFIRSMKAAPSAQLKKTGGTETESRRIVTNQLFWPKRAANKNIFYIKTTRGQKRYQLYWPKRATKKMFIKPPTHAQRFGIMK